MNCVAEKNVNMIPALRMVAAMLEDEPIDRNLYAAAAWSEVADPLSVVVELARIAANALQSEVMPRDEAKALMLALISNRLKRAEDELLTEFEELVK